MTNATAVATASAFRLQPRPTNDQPTHSPELTSPCRVDAATLEPLTALDFLDRMGDVATHWWSLIEHVLNLQVARQGKEQPLPEWASRILQDQGRHWSSHDEFTAQRDNLREVLRLAEGRATYAYEVWGDRTTRLSIRHQCVADALPDLERFKAAGHPAAKIVQLHARQRGGLATAPALLATFIGEVRFAAAMIGEGPDDDDRIELQDETGRSVTLSTSQLRGHPVLARVTNAKNRESLMAWLDASGKGGRP